MLGRIQLSKNNLKTWIILAIILLFASLIRLYDLSSIPLGFHIDEASLGYNGYSLLLTGKDENNNILPLYIDMFGDNRPSGYHYLTVLPIKFLGLNEFSTRLPGALFGIFIIFPVYFLSQVLFKKQTISLLAAFLVAIAPWSVVLSRASAETIVSLFWIVSGFTLIIAGLEKKTPIYFFAGAISLSLSFFFYHTPRVFVPLLFLCFIIVLFPVWSKFSKNVKVSLVFSFIIVCLISFTLVFLIKGGTGRFSQVNIFNAPGTQLILEEQIREDGNSVSQFITRYTHNKITNYSLAFVSNYLEYFSGQFLFIQGGFPNWYKVPGMGLLYLVELPFIIVGIFYLFFSKDIFHRLPLVWLLVAPVVAAITVDDIPNLQRVIVMFPILALVAAFGIVKIKDKYSGKFSKLFIAIFAIFLFYNFSYFLHQYFIQSQVHRNWYRYEGFDKMMKIVKDNYSNSDEIIISKSFGGIYPLVLFYMQYDPAQYQKEGSPKDKPGRGFGKFYFANSECPSYNLDPSIPIAKNSIIVDNGNCKDYKALKLLKHMNLYRKDGTRAFRIIYASI